MCEAVVTMIIRCRRWTRSCATRTRSAIAAPVVSSIVICRVVRAAPTSTTQGLGSGAASSMMPAAIVVHIMIGRIIYAASIDRAQRAASCETSMVPSTIVVRIMIRRIIRSSTIDRT